MRENKVKYPRSWHLSYSEKSTSDDKKHLDDNHFINKEVIVSIKMDGENTTIYNDYIHARSLDSKIDSEDRRWIDNLRKHKIEGNINDDMRICGENMFYKHTCSYNQLKSMFYVFSIWENDNCLSWIETTKLCDKLGLKIVPIIYNGIYDKKTILNKFNEFINSSNDDVEGFVIRIKDNFNISNFPSSLNKYVRTSFEIPDQHWKYSKKSLNKLENNKNPWEII
jgi:ATP-dependent RNA circularization protein (DNA/RNA ligase family)